MSVYNLRLRVRFLRWCHLIGRLFAAFPWAHHRGPGTDHWHCALDAFNAHSQRYDLYCTCGRKFG